MDHDDINEDYADMLRARPLLALDYGNLMQTRLPPIPRLLDPVIPMCGLTMLYAGRGIGKTMLALSMAMAVATGSKCLNWQGRKSRVVYVDGEMPLDDIQRRLLRLEQLHGRPDPDSFQLISRHMADIPDLSQRKTQDAIDENLQGCQLLVLDNLSTLLRTGVENDAESWTNVQEWLLRLRHRHIAILLVHHAGKSGQQRGTSRREDVLDTVIALRRPPGYRPAMGARFEVHLEKARSIYGEAAEPFTAQLVVEGDAARWDVSPVQSGDSAYEGEAGNDALRSEIAQLRHGGRSIRQIAEQLGISKSRVHRLSDAEG